MKVLDFNFLDSSIFKKGSIVTLGNFDGLHKGHFALIDEVKKAKKSLQLPCVVVTYSPNPSIVLGKNKDLKNIYTEKKKQELLSKMDLDFYLSIPFTLEFSQIRAFEFIQSILVEKLNAKYIVIGYNHFFGKDREGDFEYLNRFSNEFGYVVKKIEPIYFGEEKIASSAIRILLQNGNIEKANQMLGRPFSITGLVVHGEARGREIQFPTANIQTLSDIVIPAQGVYVGLTKLEENLFFKSMINIGFKPTFNGKKLTIEVHLLEFNSDLYGKEIEVFFLKKLREEKKFPSIEDLVHQLNLDKKSTVEFFETHPNPLV